MNILHVETCKIHRVGHLTLRVDTLLTQDGSLDASLLTTVGADVILSQTSGEALGPKVIERLVLVVGKALVGLLRSTLLAVEDMRRLVPYVTKCVDVEGLDKLTLAYAHRALVTGIADLCDSHTCLLHQFLERLAVLHLQHHARILGKENLHQILLGQTREVDAETAFGVGECHFEQGGDQATCADVVTCEDETLVDGLLHGIESIGEIFGVLDGGHAVAHAIECLCQSRTTKTMLAEREIDVIERGRTIELYHRAHHLAHVGHLTATADDHTAGADDLLAGAIGLVVLLRHRQRVLARRDVDTQFDGEVGTSLNSGVETCILACIAAGPHPVGRKRNARDTALDRRKHDVGECLGNCHHRACRSIDEGYGRSMADGGGDACLATVVEGYDATIGKRQLQHALALLASHLARHRTVHLVGQPVLAGNRLEAKHVIDILLDIRNLSFDRSIVMLDGRIAHDGLRGVSEHIGQSQVDGLHAVGLHEGEAHVVGSLTDHVEW